MVKLVYFSCILVFVLLESAESIKSYRVVGGVPVRSGQFPFLVSFQYHKNHRCGGAIISPTVILTAAHCIRDRNIKYISIVAGTHDLKSGGERIPASRAKKHESFNITIPGFDVGLVFLNSPLNYSETIQPIELPSPSDDFHDSNDTATVAGWGLTSNTSRVPETTARYVNIPLWGRTKCLERVPDLTEDNICAGTFDGTKNACPADSGGPLFIGNKTIGLVSWGYGCAISPIMYTSVTNYLSWINENAVEQSIP